MTRPANLSAWILIFSCMGIPVANEAISQTTIQPLQNAPTPYQPGAYGNSQPSYANPNQYPTTSNTYSVPQPTYTLPSTTDQAVSGYSTVEYPVTQPAGNTGIPAAYGYPVAGTQAGAPSSPAPYSTGGYPAVPTVGTGVPGPITVPQSSSPSQQVLPLPVPAADANVVSGGSTSPNESIEMYQPQQGNAYSWYHYPWAWIPRDGWDSSVEFGLNGAEGNTNSLSYATGADLRRKGDIYNFTLNLDYRKTQSGGVETQNNARFNSDLDRNIGDSKFATFLKGGIEYDEFKAFDVRLNGNAGLSYIWSKTDDFTFITRFGAGASSEIGSVDEDWKPEALFGLETNRQVNSRNKIFAKVDYFPAWEDFSDYRMVTDAGWEILLSDSENFSLKLSATNRYDSTPLGLKPNDVDYTATLLYKF